MIIAKPPKPSTDIFTRRSKKKGGKDDNEVEFTDLHPRMKRC